MKKIITSLTMAAMVGMAQAQTTNLVPNGDFSAGGPTTNWVEVGPITFSYPATGGNPDNYGVMDASGGGWGIWVNGDATPLTLGSLGLTSGNTYTFKADMKIISGGSIGGFKVDFFGGPGGTTGDMYPSTAGHNTAVWETYNYSVAIPAGVTGVKLVPLWGPNSSVGYDNFRVVVPSTSPLTATITSPGNLSTVGTNFTINATASVLPGTITNVYFYDGATLLGNSNTSPYSFNVVGASVGAHALKVIAKASTGGSVTSSVVNVTVVADPYRFTVDPTKSWIGYMNVFELPQNGGVFVFGQPWATADLRASYSGSTLTLSPNIIGDPAGFWYVTTNSPSVGNKSMDASFYVEPAPSLPGVTVTFTGTVLANSLVSNSNTNPAGNGWTSVAFIKDFAPDFSSSVSVTTPLTNGTVFSISLATVNDPARHVQYGFETVGPCVWATDTALPGYGKVQLGPLVSTPTSVVITPSLSGGKLNLSFPTQTGFAYTVQCRTNLTDAAWTTLTVTNGTGSTAVVTNAANAANRFYRLSIQ